MEIAKDFLDQQFKAASQGIQTTHEPVAISSWDKTQYLSLLSKAGDRTSKRRVWSRTVIPAGQMTGWLEVAGEIRPWH